MLYVLALSFSFCDLLSLPFCLPRLSLFVAGLQIPRNEGKIDREIQGNRRRKATIFGRKRLDK